MAAEFVRLDQKFVANGAFWNPNKAERTSSQRVLRS